MKVVVIFVLTFVVLQIDAKPLLRFKRATDEKQIRCVKDLNFDRQEIAEIAEISHRKSAPVDNQNYITYMKCYWTKKGYLRQDESVNYDALRQMITNTFGKNFSSDYSNNLAERALGSCRDIDADSAGLRAIKTENCIMKNLMEIVES